MANDENGKFFFCVFAMNIVYLWLRFVVTNIICVFLFASYRVPCGGTAPNRDTSDLNPSTSHSG